MSKLTMKDIKEIERQIVEEFLTGQEVVSLDTVENYLYDKSQLDKEKLFAQRVCVRGYARTFGKQS